VLASRVGQSVAVFCLAAALLAPNPSSRAQEPVEKRVQELVRLLASENFEEREKAVQELIKVGTPALEALRRASASKDAEVARLAKASVQKIEHNAKVGGLLERIRSAKQEEREEGMIGLRAIAAELDDFVPALVATLDHPNIEVREAATLVLQYLGPKSEPALSKLLRLLGDNSPGTESLRFWVINALERMGPRGREAVPTLLRILETETPQMRMHAAQGLGKLGVDEPRVGPALLRALANEDIKVRFSSAAALATLRKEPQAVHIVIRILETYPFKKEEMYLKEGFIRILGLFGPQAEPAIPYLIKVCRFDGNPDVRGEAKLTLVQIGAPAFKAIPGLKELGDNPPEYEFYELIRKTTSKP
jgi:HEAT repeat protein